MVIKAIVDRIEDGNAILLSNEIGLEISIPVDTMSILCNKGDTVTLTLDNAQSLEMRE